MLVSFLSMKGYVLAADNEELATVSDIYFDDHKWLVRYLVSDVGSWFHSQLILVSPLAIEGELNADNRSVPVRLSKQQIKSCPPIEAHLPISRQREQELAEYYQWDQYWVRGQPLSDGPPPPARPDERVGDTELQVEERDSNLRSVAELIGYTIHAADGELGSVADFLIRTEGWEVAYMVLDTGSWLPGRQVLIAPPWIDSFDWGNKHAHISLTKSHVEHAPEYATDEPVHEDYEWALRDYYGRQKDLT